ncbi:MAG: alkaline phosphatase family protein, partial [Wenzhouxiangellaceae bacterium]|nr:alkaline phosphatase family protein [Wenzhouxiangellaceae bacterium]
MLSSRSLRPTLAAAASLVLLCACGGPPEPADQRIVILGFDGMDPVLAQRWMDAGKLPNFKRLAQSGHFQPLGTSNPPQSPVAWSNFATGDHPGEHGIFDFLRRNPETYGPQFSISENIPPESHLELFGLSIPLDEGQVLNRRRGRPFWSDAEQAGARASVLRVPVTYPPDPIHRMLSGMGVPDLLGTQGTYTFYTTTRMDQAGSSTRVVRVRPGRDGTIETALEGPPDPLRQQAEPMQVPLVIEPAGPGARVRLGDTETTLQPGEWSDWVRLKFDVTGPVNVTGTVRVLLVQDYPRPRLYVSPIQIDPMAPAVPISSPPKYAAELAERIGMYHTIGMPEETWSLNEEHISDAAWLEMEKT